MSAATDFQSTSTQSSSDDILRSKFAELLFEEEDEDEIEGGQDTDRVWPLERQSVPENEASGRTQRLDTDSSEDADEIVLSMIWTKNRLGAAYYNVRTCELFVLEDAHEVPPRFDLTKTLYRECRPRYVVLPTGTSGDFTSAVKKLIITESLNDDRTSASSNDRACGIVLKTVPKKEHDFERSYHRVRCLRLRSEPKNASNAERLAFLNTVLNFKSNAMIHALGSLLIFIDKHWNGIALDPYGKPVFVGPNHVTLRDLVTVDDDTYKALGILRSRHHPSFFKFGNANAKTQGVSLFAFLNRCRSRPGVDFLWKMLHRPTRDLVVLNRRLDVIEFFMDPKNQNVVENLSSCLGHVYRLTNDVLSRCSGLRTRASDWHKLYKTVSHVIYIADLCGVHAEKIALFGEIADGITNEMRYVKYFIEYIVDFDAWKRENDFVVKANVDPLLDELNHARNTLPELLTRMGERDMREYLPASVTSCNMLYLPNIGYVLAIREWNPTPPEDASLPGLEFKFTINGVRYYKSPSARELDDTIGDIVLRITKRQSQIMLKLMRYVSKHAESILGAIRLCAELDALLALYTVARDYNYARPSLVESQIIAVKEGRHPLQEFLTTFVPNDVYSGNGGSLVKILTGPNACGKSIYLKQIGLIVFMAHIGSYVPAKSATIGVVTHISTQMFSADSVALNASTFLQDLRQINIALRASTANSLVLIDEFGKGTSEVSGLSLLAAVLSSFVERGSFCPHVFAVTHMHRVLGLLPQSPLVETQTFEYVASSEDSLAFLYRLVGGSTTKSFAHSIAQSSGLDERIVQRSTEVLERMKEGTIPSRLSDAQRQDTAKHVVERVILPNPDYDMDELKFWVRRVIFPVQNNK